MQELFKSKIVGGQSCKGRSIFPDPPLIQTLATATAMQSLQRSLTCQAGTCIRSGHLQKYSSFLKAGLQALFGKFIFRFEYACCEFRLWLTLKITIAYLPLRTAVEVQTALKGKPCPEDLGIKDLIPSVFTSVHCTEGKHAVFQHLLHLHPQAQPGWKQSEAGLKGDCSCTYYPS